MAQQTKGIAGCLADLGYPARLIPPDQGGWGIEPPTGLSADQSAGYGRAIQECVAAFPDPITVMSHQFAEQIWDRQLSILKCLQDNGFPVQGQPPAKDVFVGQLLSKGVADWSAFDLLPARSDVQLSASSTCSQAG